MTLNRAAALAAAAMLTFALAMIGSAPAFAAATVTVNTTLDETQPGNGTCSLREATLFANGGTAEPDCAPGTASGTTTIVVPGGLFRLRGQALTLTANAVLTGAGAAATTIDAAGGSQVLVVGVQANVTVSDATITGGVSGQTCAFACGTNDPVIGDAGGGITNNGGTLALTRVIVTGNRTSPGATQTNCMPQIQSPCPGGDGGQGGGIANFGTTTITDSAVTANSTGAGAPGKPGVQSSVFFGGEAGTSGSGGPGGGIVNFQTLTIANSTIAGNTTGAGAQGADGGTGVGVNGGIASSGGDGGSGGGIDNEFGGQVVISGSTISGNETGIGAQGGKGGSSTASGGGIGHGADGAPGGSGGSGGGIVSQGNLTISNSTIVDNSVASSGASGQGGIPSGITQSQVGGANGGGIEELRMGSSLTHVTIVGNRTPGFGGGVDGDGGTIAVGNSIVASNQAVFDSNCDGVVTDLGSNVEFGDASCPPGFLHADPRLSPLAANGGPTQTVALQPGSAAIHHVPTCVLSSDQRGVARPVGSACDSGAYEAAPPVLSGPSASAITTTTATVSAAVNPTLRDTTVVMNYGLTTNYGSSAPPVRVSAGNAPVPFSVALSGLTPGTTYHVDVVATSADGTTTSSDGVFTTLSALTASIAGATTAGPSLSLTIVCAGGSGPGTCSGPIDVRARSTTNTAPGTKRRRKHGSGGTQVVATGVYSVASGSGVTVTIQLNPAGRRLLASQYVLPATLSVGGTTPMTLPVTFSYPLIKSGVSYTWAFGARSSTARELTVTRIPPAGKVRVICHGGGCPFAQRTFAARRGRVVLTPAFRGHPLRPGATLVVEIIAANQVGKAETFKIRSGQGPAVNQECLPPGTSRPARCV
jgi:CSLREA domain-containing protein